jgi:hypothetical protein
MKAISLARIFPDHPNHRLAFTRQSLTVIKDLLAAHTTASDSPLFLTASPPSLVSSASTDGEYRARKGSTAILVGLCNADGMYVKWSYAFRSMLMEVLMIPCL